MPRAKKISDKHFLLMALGWGLLPAILVGLPGWGITGFFVFLLGTPAIAYVLVSYFSHGTDGLVERMMYRKGGAALSNYSQIKSMAMHGKREEAIAAYLEAAKTDSRDDPLREALSLARQKPQLDKPMAKALQQLIRHPQVGPEERERFRELLSGLVLEDPINPEAY